jgi:hypothetical protein
LPNASGEREGERGTEGDREGNDAVCDLCHVATNGARRDSLHG